MKVEFSQHFGLDCQLGSINAKEESIRNNNCCPAILFQAVHNKYHKKVSSLTGAHIHREITLDTCFSAATIRRIHGDDLHLITFLEVTHLSPQRIAVLDIGSLNVVD